MYLLLSDQNVLIETDDSLLMMIILHKLSPKLYRNRNNVTACYDEPPPLFTVIYSRA